MVELAAAVPGRREGGRRWLVVAAVAMVACLGAGTHWYAVGVFYDPLVRAFGWGRGPYSLAISLYVIMTTIGAGPVGALVDRWGPRRVLAASAVLGALAWYGVARLGRLGAGDPLWQLYLLYIVAGMCGAGLGDVPISTLVVRWFRERRGLAMGLATVGYGLPGIFLVPLSAGLLAAQGWRALAVGTAALTLGCLPFILWLLHDRPPRESAGASLFERALSGLSVPAALRVAPFWLIGAAALLTQFTSVAVQMQAIPFLMGRGLSRELASDAVGFLALAGIAGKLALGYVADRLSARAAIVAALLLEAAGLVVTLAWPGGGAAWLFAVLFGLGMGGLVSARPLLVQEYFGLRAFGAISGLLLLFTVPGIAAGQTMAGYLYDITGSYHLSSLIFVGALGLGVALLLLARRPTSLDAGEAGRA